MGSENSNALVSEFGIGVPPRRANLVVRVHSGAQCLYLLKVGKLVLNQSIGFQNSIETPLTLSSKSRKLDFHSGNRMAEFLRVAKLS